MSAFPPYLAGFLLTRGDRPLTSQDLASLPNLRVTDQCIDDWVLYTYQTPKAIAGVSVPIDETPPPLIGASPSEAPPAFRYPVVFRLGPLAFQLFAADQLIALHLVRRELPRLRTLVRACEIKVHDLVTLFTQPVVEPAITGEQVELDTTVEERYALQTEYRIGYVAASTDAFPSALKGLQFSGDHVTDAKIFRDNLNLYKCHGCTLKQSQLEILRLGKDGFVSFHLPNAERLRRRRLKSVAHLLKSLYAAEYIQLPGKTTL